MSTRFWRQNLEVRAQMPRTHFYKEENGGNEYDRCHQRQREMLNIIRDVQNYLQTTWVANIITTELNILSF